MLRKWLKQHLPGEKTINNSFSKNFLRHPNVWCLNSFSVSMGAAVGLFVAFIPFPMQMLIAALLAILFRANLPVAVVMTWITNPFTFVPINYFIFWVGKKILGESAVNSTAPAFSWHFENLSQFWSSLFIQFSQLGKAYFVGLPIVAIGVAVLGYIIVRIVWHLRVSTEKKRRRVKKK